MSIHVLPLAHGDCPTLICESADVCYFGDWRIDIDPPKHTWINLIPGLGDFPTDSGYRLGLDYGPIPNDSSRPIEQPADFWMCKLQDAKTLRLP